MAVSWPRTHSRCPGARGQHPLRRAGAGEGVPGTVQLNEHCGEVTEISPDGIPGNSPEPLLHALNKTFGPLRNTRSHSKPPAPPGTDAATLGTRNPPEPSRSCSDHAIACLGRDPLAELLACRAGSVMKTRETSKFEQVLQPGLGRTS